MCVSRSCTKLHRAPVIECTEANSNKERKTNAQKNKIEINQPKNLVCYGEKKQQASKEKKTFLDPIGFESFLNGIYLESKMLKQCEYNVAVFCVKTIMICTIFQEWQQKNYIFIWFLSSWSLSANAFFQIYKLQNVWKSFK